MIPVNKFKLFASDRNIVIKALKNNWISSAGPEVKEFENKFKKLIGHKYCSSVSSGSAALDVALKVIDIKKGDEVIIPNFTIISSAISGYRTVLLMCIKIIFWKHFLCSDFYTTSQPVKIGASSMIAEGTSGSSKLSTTLMFTTSTIWSWSVSVDSINVSSTSFHLQ